MLLVIRNLPSTIKYADIKLLIQKKCFITEIILDKLVKDGATSKKVTVGVAKEEDATRILHRLNGTYIEGQQIFIENVNSQSDNKPVDMDAYSTYQPPQNDLNLMMASNQQMNNPNAWNMQMYGYGMPDQAMVYQAGMNTQMMQGYGGYNAWMTSSGNPSMMQSNVMGYGNQHGQQGLQYSTTQGQFDGSFQPRGSQNESEFGRTSGDRLDERGYTSDRQNETEFSSGNSWNETGYSSGNQKDRGYSSQKSYPNTQKDRGSGSQGFLGGSRQNDRDRGAQPSWGRSQQEDRGRRSPQPLMGSNQRGYSSGEFDEDRFGSGNQRDSIGYGGQSNKGNSQRETRDLSQNSWGDNRNRGFDRPRDGNDRPQGRDGDRPQGPDDERKRRYSPERDNTHRGNSREGFQSNSGFEGNQSRGFDRNRDSRDFRRAGPSRDSHPTKVASKPLLELPSWYNSQPRPYGSDKPDFNKGTPGDNSKGRIQWNRNPGPPLSHSSPVKNPMPPKRAKVEEPALKVVVKEYDFDQKAVNRAISWRGEGVSLISKQILLIHKKDFLCGQKAFQFGTKLLKKRINERLDEIIKKKYPGDPYPVLSGPEIVKLYRDHHPVGEDHKLFKFVFEDPSVTALADDVKPNEAGTSDKLMGPPSGTKVPHVKTNGSPMKPKVPLKTFVKPTLADLLPPEVLQTQPDKMPRPWVPPGHKKLMLGPNALKNKPKPYNVEKRARTEQKQLAKKEFLLEDLYRCGIPAQEKALNEVLDELTNVFNAAIDELPATTPEEKIIGASIQEKVAPEFRAMARLHTIKRMLNITSTLLLRIFVHGGKATKEDVETALKQYGILNLKSASQSKTKTQLFVAGVKTYYNYDKLCNSPGIPVPGKFGTSTITAKPLHLTIPFKYRRLLCQKKYVDLTGDDDNENFGGDGEGDDDDDDDEDADDDDDDDDVIEVTKDNEVIELSGDETTLNVPDEGNCDVKKINTKSENKADESDVVNKSDVGTEKTVDLTLEGDEDGTVDERMSAAIAKQMGDSVVEIDEEEIREDDLEDY